MTRDQALGASDDELARFLTDNKVSTHRYEYGVHYHSARLRQMSKDRPMMVEGYEFFSAVADSLDSLFQRSNHGRIHILSLEEKREKALVIIEKGPQYAQHQSQASPDHGSSGPQSQVRQESGYTTVRGQGVQPGR